MLSDALPRTHHAHGLSLTCSTAGLLVSSTTPSLESQVSTTGKRVTAPSLSIHAFHLGL